MAHKLALDIRDGQYDNRFIYANDISAYDTVLGVVRRKLQVLPPFTDEYITLPFAIDQMLAISTNHLGLSTEAQDLPDGLYKFHLSVAPNDKVFIWYHHFRTARLMNAVLHKMMLVSVECNESVDECGNVDINKYNNMLLHIWMLLKGAQAAGRNELHAEKAKGLYSQANKAYERLFNIETCKMC